MLIALAFKTNNNSILLYIKVSSNTKENKVVGSILKEDKTYIKVNIKALKIKNQANLELIAFLAQILKIKQNQITIKNGLTNSFKTIEIKDLDVNELPKELLKC